MGLNEHSFSDVTLKTSIIKLKYGVSSFQIILLLFEYNVKQKKKVWNFRFFKIIVQLILSIEIFLNNICNMLNSFILINTIFNFASFFCFVVPLSYISGITHQQFVWSSWNYAWHVCPTCQLCIVLDRLDNLVNLVRWCLYQCYSTFICYFIRLNYSLLLSEHLDP